MKFPVRALIPFFVLVALLIAGGSILAAPAEATMPQEVTVVGAPLGRFGFVTNFGGPLWRRTIGHLVVRDVQQGGPAEQGGMRDGDEILEIDGLRVPGGRRSEVYRALRSKDAGKIVVFKVASDKGRGPERILKVRPVEKL